MHRHPRAESVGIAARPRLCGPRATLESATLPALPRAGSRDLRARRVSTADLEKGEELQVALGSCSEHKEGIMVLLVKGGERLIMRPCNLAHSSRAFEDFCRGQRRKTTRIRRPAWSCSSCSRPQSPCTELQVLCTPTPRSPQTPIQGEDAGSNPCFCFCFLFWSF